IDWAVRYWEQAKARGLPVPADFGDFWRELEWMGLQRHLKVLGIFCRLKHRDGKPSYSADLPRFFRYAHRVATRYQGLGPLARLRAGTCLRVGIAAYSVKLIKCHCGNTRSSACSSNASSATNDGSPAIPRPCSAAAYKVSTWIVPSTGRCGTSVTESPPGSSS